MNPPLWLSTGILERYWPLVNQPEEWLARTPGNIVAIRPLQDGVIADFDITELMLSILLIN